MKHRSFLIKPASSLCNMSCAYCFYCDVAKARKEYSFGIMDTKTMQNLITKSLAGDVDHVTYAFQGGEPTLAGLSYFGEFIKTVNTYKQAHQNIQYALQTNGFILNREWARFFKDNDFLIGVSLDGFEDNHDKMRKDQKKLGTFNRVMQSIALLQEYAIPYNILTVLTKSLSKQPEKLYQFYKRNNFSYVQLIPCLPDLGVSPNVDPYALTPKGFASFYNTFFKSWYKDYQKGKYMSVTLFDNVIPMFNGIPPQQCGMLGFCQPQFVIESDGSVYPCDFYALDSYRLGNINTDTMKELAASKIISTFIDEPRRQSIACKACTYKKICEGNCKRLNIAYFDDKGYCGYQEFLHTNINILVSIAKK